MPVHDVYQPALIKRDVIALRRRPVGHRLRDEIADFARGLRIGNVDDAQPAAEPDGVDESPGHALAELVRAETCAARAAERGIELAQLKLRERPDGRNVSRVKHENAGMRAAAARLLFGGALGLIFLIDRGRATPSTDPVP